MWVFRSSWAAWRITSSTEGYAMQQEEAKQGADLQLEANAMMEASTNADSKEEGEEVNTSSKEEKPAEALQETLLEDTTVAVEAKKTEDEEQQNLQEPEAQDLQATDGQGQMVPANQVVAEQNDDFSEEDMQVQCRKCGRCVHVTESLHRTEKTRWCLSCNALVTLMRRHMSWPPDEFAKLSEESQKTFFLKAVEEKAGASAFRYDRVRDLLVKTMVKMHISESKTETGGTYKPLSVFAKDGYILPPEFEHEAPKLWSEPLRCWTYLLPELTVKETEINRSMEEAIVRAEKVIKKRKQLPDAAAGSVSQKAKVEALEDMVVDLLSDEDDAEASGRSVFMLLVYHVYRVKQSNENQIKSDTSHRFFYVDKRLTGPQGQY